MNREVNHKYGFEIHKHIFKYIVDYISFVIIRSVSQNFIQQTLHSLSSQTMGVFRELKLGPFCADYDVMVLHYDDVIMTTMASQITSLTVVYSTIYSDAVQRKHQSSASLALCVGNSPRTVNSPHKGPVTRKMFPFDDVIMAGRAHTKPLLCRHLTELQNWHLSLVQ